MRFSAPRMTGGGLLLAAVAFWYAVQSQLPANSQPGVVKAGISDRALLELTAHRVTKLHRVNEEPHLVSVNVSAAQYVFAAQNEPGFKFNCEPLGNSGASIDPHADFSVVVYLTKDERQIMATGKGNYPVNTVILKEKFVQPQRIASTDSAATPADDELGKSEMVTQLFTGMLKREAGYNPNGGDWEYFVVSGDAKKLVERGKITSCIDCHEGYKDTDYVTRAYLPAVK